MITIEQVREALEQISKLAEDYKDEEPHMRQDRLYVSVLRAIANGAENPKELAAEALKVRKIKFTRWYS